MTVPERTWETSRLFAKPAAVADAQVVFDDYASDPAVAKYTTWTPHRSVADTKEFLSRCERVWIEGSAFPWESLAQARWRVRGTNRSSRASRFRGSRLCARATLVASRPYE